MKTQIMKNEPDKNDFDKTESSISKSGKSTTMKFSSKLIIDFAMAIVMLLLLRYNMTGSLIHEIIGLVLLVGFLFHILINRGYLKNIFKILSLKNGKLTRKIGVVLNLILLCSAVIMLISSIMISREIFTFLKISSNYDLWRFLHVICAYIMLSVVFAHVVLHWNAIGAFVKKTFALEQISKTWSISVRCLAAVLAVIILKVSIENAIKSVQILGGSYGYKENAYVTETQQSSQNELQSSGQDYNQPNSQDKSNGINQETSQPSIKDTDNSEKETEAQINSSSQETSKESLEDYLSKLTCTGCGKHCSLLNPQCGKGASQKAAATTAYNNM